MTQQSANHLVLFRESRTISLVKRRASLSRQRQRGLAGWLAGYGLPIAQVVWRTRKLGVIWLPGRPDARAPTIRKWRFPQVSTTAQGQGLLHCLFAVSRDS